MANVLEKIVADKRLEVERLKQQLPLANFINQLQPSNKDMYAALNRKQGQTQAGFILECKKASPSKGLIRADFNVKQICQTYDKYAAAISVLTDEKYFQGSYDYLKIVTESVSCPVLNKDFFIDSYQVYLARHYGADAILLMLSVLDDDQYQALAEVAQSLNLAILTEISNQEELARAIALGAKLIGINNRNLRDLSTDISRTFDFAPQIPEDRIVISESGIYTNQQVRELAPAVDGFLVGSSVMAQENIDLACRSLIFGDNKVCGLTASCYAQYAIEAGAKYGGLIFAEKSPRYIDLAQAHAITTEQPDLSYVGVFVDAPLQQVVAYASELSLYAVQLHGNETQADIAQLRQLLPKNIAIWKACKVTQQLPALSFEHVDHYVIDGNQPGSGQAFNWQLLNDSQQTLKKVFLAGGLKQSNIEQAMELLTSQELFGLDINSGVETSPGIKDRAKLKALFARIRNY